jgi:transcriptional regulator with XRE-family HTH domain
MKSDDNTLPDRIRKCVDLVGNGNEFSRITGINRRTLDYYLSGTSEPKATALAAIAEAAEVTLDWLITGKGDPSGAAVIAPLDMEALEAAIALTEEAAKSVGAKLTPDKKASISAIIYEDIADSPDNQTSNVDMANVLRLVRLAV